MKNESLPFEPSEQHREGCAWHRKEAMLVYVHDFFHLEEGSLMDIESYRVFMGHNLVISKKVKHPMLVWHDNVGLTAQYQAFCESEAYSGFHSKQ
jgi:hypothetical protein